MAITVNGFGGTGGGYGQRGNYYLRLENANGAALSGMTVTSNPTPAVGSMQKVLDIPGPGRLLLLAAYGNARNQNKMQHYGSTSSEMVTKGYARVRIAADDRIIYKACMMVTLTREGVNTGAHIPPLVWDPFFASVFQSGDSSTLGSISLVLRDGRHPLPAVPNSGDLRGRRVTYIDGPGTDWSGSYRFASDIAVSYYLHTPEDDNKTGVLDYDCSVIPGGLYFDGNLTIHAAYGLAPSEDSKNGILAIYELFGE